MAERQPQTIAVIGAGIVGVSTAIWLQRAGIKVTLIDREGPAAGTSYGNAGVLASGSIVPVSVPGLLYKAPRMLLDPNSPLFLRWSYLPKLIPWLLPFLRNGSRTKVMQIARSLSLMLHDSPAQHLALAEGTGAERFIETGDYVFGYKDKATFATDAFTWATRGAMNSPYEEMDAARIAAYDPALQGRFGYAVRCPEHGHITDPGAYVRALAAHFVTKGGDIITAEVTDLALDGGRVASVETTSGPLEADGFVLTAGVWSRALAEKLGLKVPLETERGYHIEFVNPSIKPKSPVMVAAGKFVMTPMVGRLRCAGIVEFGGIDAPPSEAPFALLEKQTLAIFPELTFDSTEKWMGHRPSTVDSLPLIGPFGTAPNLWAGFGHQHVGLTGGPKTGRWLAQIITGQTPNADLAPMAPNRFR